MEKTGKRLNGGRKEIEMKAGEMKRLALYFEEKARRLARDVELEIEKVGGEDMVLSREDLMHWVYESRLQIEHYHTICRMLIEQESGAAAEAARQELLDTLADDRRQMDEINKRRNKEDAALQTLQEEAEFYRKTLEALKRL